MIDKKIYQCLINSLDRSNQAVFFYHKNQHIPFHSNKQSQKRYADKDGIIDLYTIFQSEEAHLSLKNSVIEHLQQEESARLYDVCTVTNQGELLLCDVEVAYADEEKEIFFFEMYAKGDMDAVKSQVYQSIGAMAILESDDILSVFYCNQPYQSLFAPSYATALPEGTAKNFSCVFPPVKGKTQVRYILNQLHTLGFCSTKLQIPDENGTLSWYSVELEKRNLDGTGEKIIVQLSNIQHLVQMEQDLDEVNQYFSIVQSMTENLLYRFNIESRTLVRSEETARLYNVPTVTENFPPKPWLDRVMHPDDIQGFIDFMDLVAQGQDGSHTARLKNPEGILQYHEFTFQGLRRGDGSVKEMVGCAMNIHNLKETQLELEKVNQYFGILQSLTRGMLYRLDIKNHILYRNRETAHFYHVPSVEENYPCPEKLKGVLHEEDIPDYVQFIHFVLTGGEGSHTARLFAPSGKFEYHKITFKAMKDKDGSIREMVGTAVNVQELKNTEEQLSTVNQYFDILQSFSKDLLYRFDINTRTLYRNEGTSVYYGIPPVVHNYPNYESLIGVFHPDDIPNYTRFIKKVLKGEEGTHTARLISPSGNFEYHKFTFKGMERQDGKIHEMIGHAVNIHSIMELEMKATFDMLTNCLNKNSFQEQVEHILANSTIQQRHALFFIDLDDFKGINDNLGHSFGDFLLETVGARLKNLVRDNDLVGRVGGDEFVLFLESCGDDLHLEKRGMQILESLREKIQQNSTTAQIKGSVGVAIFPNHGTTYEELYHNSDVALYHSKFLGKDVATIYYKGLGKD